MTITTQQRHITNNSHFVVSTGLLRSARIKPIDTFYTQLFYEAAQSAGSISHTNTNPIMAWLKELYDNVQMWHFFRKQRSAFAFIAVGTGEQRRYLLQWNEAWCGFNLIGGKLDDSKGDKGLLNRALQRELEEELGLKRGEDFEIGRCLKTIKMRQFSRSDNKLKRYRFGVFDVNLFPRLWHSLNSPNYAARWLSTRYENVFASAEEIANLTTADGRPISRTTRSILQKIGELPY